MGRTIFDRGGFRPGGFPGGMGRGGRSMPRLPLGRRGGMGGILGLVIIGVLYLLFSGGETEQQPMDSGIGRDMAPASGRASSGLPQDALAQFVAVVLADTEETWHAIFAEGGGRYQEPTLVLFSDGVQSACGFTQAAVGPFYCPADRKLYIDLSFYDALKRRFGAPGDLAQAYVIAHEVGHHVQTLLGISDQVQEAKRRASQTDANRLQVRMELQADCFAGIWAYQADRVRGLLDPGDIDEALRAAAAIGDDRLQRQSHGHVVPDAFTHGTSEQRQRWFRIGYDTGSVNACNTFEARDL